MNDLKDYVPALDDQGVANAVGSPVRGVSLQFDSYIAGAGADPYVFATNGMEDMADATYEAIGINQTAAARSVIVGGKTTKQFTITGQNAADVMTIIVIGRVKGQSA